MLKLARSWNFIEAMKNVRSNAATKVQKFMKGYLVHKYHRTLIALSVLDYHLQGVNQFVEKR